MLGISLNNNAGNVLRNVYKCLRKFFGHVFISLTYLSIFISTFFIFVLCG